MNKFVFSGRLTNDVAYFPAKNEGGSAAARFGVAINNRKDDAVFVDCVSFGKGADFANQYFKKGTHLMITAHAQARKDENGKQTGIQFVVEDTEFIDPKNKGEVTAE